MNEIKIKYKQLTIDPRWKIVKNEFIDLEPDNDYPIDDVFYYFDEDILHASFEDYYIDLGFYGGYHDNTRDGFFKIVVFKGDFNDGVFFEFYISRSTDEIRDKLNFYFDGIPNGLLDNVKGITYDDNYDFGSFHIYSSIDNVSYRLTKTQLDELSKAKK